MNQHRHCCDGESGIMYDVGIDERTATKYLDPMQTFHLLASLIFIANLAFDNAQIQDIAVLAVIVASVVSALISITLFKLLARK